jgi:Mrp family chromosome partitioning ATPase
MVGRASILPETIRELARRAAASRAGAGPVRAPISPEVAAAQREAERQAEASPEGQPPQPDLPRAPATGATAPARVKRRKRPEVRPAELQVVKHLLPPRRSRDLIFAVPNTLTQMANVRALRHRLVERGDPKVILVSSVNPGEGKTFCATSLAFAIAETRRARVLLIEANALRPRLARLLGLAEAPCFFAQLAAHKDSFDRPWKVAELENYAVHAMPVAPDRKELADLDPLVLAGAIDRLAAAYDYVVIDGPCVADGRDITMLEEICDGVLFVARAGKTRARGLREAIEQISPSVFLGVTLNGA